LSENSCRLKIRAGSLAIATTIDYLFDRQPWRTNMHRADRDVVDKIEQTFRNSGFSPIQGDWSSSTLIDQRCALGALLSEEQATSPFSHQIAAATINRSEAWVGFFVSAFDQWPEVNEQVFDAGGYDEGEYSDRSRGYRAGWECARRLLSELRAYRAAG
jgi:hypothetical protein